MKAGKISLVVLLVGLLCAGLGASSIQGGRAQEQPIYLMLQAGTFDPLQGEPLLPAGLTIQEYPEGIPGAYIVQFNGPVQEGWTEQLTALGGTVLDYLPDYAYVVWMDRNAKEQAGGLEGVRWVGMYQPAYKLSPDLGMSTNGLYRVTLFPGTDLSAIQGRLKTLNAPTSEVTGETFQIYLPDKNPEAVALWPEVSWIEPYLMNELHNDIGGGTIMGGTTAWAAALNGSGMKVTVADTGIDSGVDTATAGDMHTDFDNRFTNIHSWPVQSNPTCWTNAGADDTARDTQSGHGTHVLGSVAGNGASSSGQIKGLAFQSALTFQAIEQLTVLTGACGSGSVYALSGIPDDLNTLFQEAYTWGSRIHSNSWGSNAQGAYTSTSADVDEFIWNHPDFTILFSAGNEGTDANADGYVDDDSIGAPATSKNAITSGASDNERTSGGISTWSWHDAWPSDFPTNPTRDDKTSDTRQELAAFSSRGPTNDGRLKPDVVAPGTNILSTRSGYITGNGWGAYSNPKYMYNGGTSMSNPLIAGAAALVREYYVEKRSMPAPSAALIKATLINSAAEMTGYGNTAQEAGRPIPNNHEGWGRVNVAAATSGQRNVVDGVTVTTGVTRTYNYQVNSAGTPLKVTLGWSDYPASTASAKQLVNNVDLRVTAPNGTTIYLGNRFSGGWSVTGGTADNTNNVEGVYIQNPAVGNWKIEVIGTNIAHGPQPFALVTTGSFGATARKPRIYSPMLFNKKAPPPPPPPSKPTAGFWQNASTSIEFYVTTDQASVDNFAVYISVPLCGNWKITRTSLTPIVNNQFTGTGAFYFNGTFTSVTAANGQAGLTNFYLPGCGYVTGGPWPYTASWVNSSQPTFNQAEVIQLDDASIPGLEAWREEP